MELNKNVLFKDGVYIVSFPKILKWLGFIRIFLRNVVKKNLNIKFFVNVFAFFLRIQSYFYNFFLKFNQKFGDKKNIPKMNKLTN